MTAAQTFPPSLVLGAAGFLGLNLVDALVARGQSPRCGRRVRTNVLALRQRKVPLVQTDFDLHDTLRAAMAGIDTVFHLGGHYPRLSLEPQKERALGLARLENVLDAAASAGVRRLLYVSSTATVAPRADGRPSTEADVFSAPPPWGAYHELKWHLEARAAAESRLEVLIVCPGACLGPWDLRVGTSAMLVGLARGLDVPHPDGLVSWVDARDVANALVALATHEAPPRRVLVAAESLQLQHLLEVAARFYGVIAPPPMSDADALAFADDEEHRAAAGGPRARLARELVDLIIHGPAIAASLAQRALGITYRPLDTTLVDFDAWARRVRFIPPKAQERTA
ncbi:MAG: NAD-dependent epimerase/dehydratase family protein [Myxococcales bacterium]|nr:NAD-dependent epimerase/dehydratase family protein [Myxococcales bacterium]